MVVRTTVHGILHIETSTRIAAEKVGTWGSKGGILREQFTGGPLVGNKLHHYSRAHNSWEIGVCDMLINEVITFNSVSQKGKKSF